MAGIILGPAVKRVDSGIRRVVDLFLEVPLPLIQRLRVMWERDLHRFQQEAFDEDTSEHIILVDTDQREDGPVEVRKNNYC